MSTKPGLAYLGLSENEFMLYQAFLTYGEQSAAEIARLVKMDKSSAYRAVDILFNNRLVTKNFRTRGTTYSAVGPDILRDVFTSKKVELESKSSELNILIENLKKESENSERSTYITIEKGIAAIEHRMIESLNAQEKLIREKWSDPFRVLNDTDHVKFVVDYAKKRAAKGIFIRQLEEPDWVSDGEYTDVMTDQKKYHKEVRRLPKDATWRDNSFRIWDDTANIVSFDADGNYIVVTMKDKFVVKLLKDLYDFMWLRAERVE